MKNILTVFLIVISVSDLMSQTENLNLAAGNCKVVEGTRKYYGADGFCSTSLYIDSDSSYTFESGCEGRSYVSIGKWQIFNDSLFLFPLEQSMLQPFCMIKTETTDNDSTITFVIKDKFGFSRNDLVLPVTEQTEELNELEHYLFLNNWKDSLIIFKKDIEGFKFPKISLLTGNSFILDINDLSSIVSLNLNLNSASVIYDEISYIYDRIPMSWKITRKEISSGKIVLKQTDIE